MLLQIRVSGGREQFAHGGIDIRCAIVVAQTMEYLIERRCELWLLENAMKQDPGASVARCSQFVDQLLREFDKAGEPSGL
jgi:hypothetical protein